MTKQSFKTIRSAVFNAMLAGSLMMTPSIVNAGTARAALPDVNADAMREAWHDASAACRKEVHRVLAEYQFYQGSIDGRWRDSTLEGIKKYVAAGEYLEWNTISYEGSLGLLWHIGISEQSCPYPHQNEL